jgi:hypothetical protein
LKSSNEESAEETPYTSPLKIILRHNQDESLNEEDDEQFMMCDRGGTHKNLMKSP